MPVDIHDQIRALAEQLDRDIPHVSSDEVLERFSGSVTTVRPSHRPETSELAEPKPSRRWLTAVAAALIMVLVGGLLVINRGAGDGSNAAPTSSPNGEAVVIPDLIGATSADAINQLRALGLDVVVAVVSDDSDGTFDTVVATDPVAATAVAAGTTVRVTITSWPDHDDPLDFATTDEALPIWPHMSVSEPAATAAGYGLASCSGVATMRAAVDSSAGPEHSYYGTMCSFITLDEPRPATVVSCSTLTTATDYARCQRLTEPIDTEGAGTNRPTTAKGDEADRVDPLSTPTGWDVPAIFATAVTAVDNAPDQIDYEDERVTVTINAGDDYSAAKLTIRLPGAVVEATAGSQILQSGLAYAAYQDRSDAIDIVGIVPDDAIEVEIAGTVIPVTNNVWHYTSTTDQTLDFIVRSADGTSAST